MVVFFENLFRKLVWWWRITCLQFFVTTLKLKIQVQPCQLSEAIQTQNYDSQFKTVFRASLKMSRWHNTFNFFCSALFLISVSSSMTASSSSPSSSNLLLSASITIWCFSCRTCEGFSNGSYYQDYQNQSNTKMRREIQITESENTDELLLPYYLYNVSASGKYQNPIAWVMISIKEWL